MSSIAMNRQGKIWGNTALVFACGNVEVHRIEVVSGGYCSRHRHAHKHNRFFVESGTLEVIVRQPEEIEDTTRLGPGDSCTVPPGAEHRFKAVRDTVAYEIYWVALDGEDIERADTGGVCCQEERAQADE